MISGCVSPFGMYLLQPANAPAPPLQASRARPADFNTSAAVGVDDLFADLDAWFATFWQDCP